MYTRGVLTTGAGGYGYVQSMDHNNDGDELLIKNETGVTKVQDLYDERNEITVQAKFDRDQTLPDRGDTITLAACPKTSLNGAYTLKSITVNEQNQDAASVTLNLVRYIDGELPVSGS